MAVRNFADETVKLVRVFPITREQLDKMLVDFGMEPALGWTPTKGYSRVDEIHHWLDEFEEKTTDKVSAFTSSQF